MSLDFKLRRSNRTDEGKDQGALMKKPKICMHYGMTGPAFRPIMYITDEGQVIRCPVCRRRVVDKRPRRAVRRWNRDVRIHKNIFSDIKVGYVTATEIKRKMAEVQQEMAAFPTKVIRTKLPDPTWRDIKLREDGKE